MVRDIAGDLYTIRDLESLDPASRKEISGLVDQEVQNADPNSVSAT